MDNLLIRSESESLYNQDTSPPANLSIEEQTELWHQVQHHSVNGLVGLTAVRDKDGQITDFQYRFINDIAFRDTLQNQLTPSQPTTSIIGRLLTEFYPSIRQTPLWQTYTTVVETGKAGRFEQHYDLDGRDIWIIQSAAPFGQDGLLLSYAETSDLHLAARRVTRQSALLNGVLNSSPNGIVVFEAMRNDQHELVDFQISLANRRFEILTNCESGYFVGLPLARIYPVGPRRLKKLQDLLETGEPIYFNEYVATIGRWLDITLTRLNDGFVATIQDVTIQKQTSQQLEATVQELHRTNQNLKQFAYLASHDLQEPLRKIVSFGDVLNEHFTDGMSEPAADLVRRMQRSAGRMRSLVEDLLTYAQLSGNIETFRQVDLNLLLPSVAEDLEMMIYEQQATLQLESLPTVWGDATLLRQLFQNLLSNALKFQPSNRSADSPKPHITVQGNVAADHEIPAELRQPTADSKAGFRYAVIKVIDNGIGFDNRYLDRIFMLFQRLHGRQNYAGTGTGLAICKKVVDLHEGYITARSAEGHGTMFIIYLPIR